jgi:uncharacterized protein (TIGR02679 family)
VAVVWDHLRQRLDQRGVEWRGRLRLPPLDDRARLVLKGLIGREPGVTVPVADLERALVGLAVGCDLDSALTGLGFPPSAVVAAGRQQRRLRRSARRTAEAEVAAWPEPWAGSWVDGELAAGSFAGVDEAGVVELLDGVRLVLDVVIGPTEIDLVVGRHGPSRTDLAARLFGSAHALDPSEPLGRLANRALATALAGEHTTPWEQAGYHTDLVSHPVPTWNLPLPDGSPLGLLVATATGAGLPLPITRMALLQDPLAGLDGRDVVCVENPRLVEAAADSNSALPVITTNGNPRRTAVLLVQQLLSAGATVHYHGDFDSAGLAICQRMVDLGCAPLAMTGDHYQRCLTAATGLGVDLPRDTNPVVDLSWCAHLAEVFNHQRLIVHEELFFLPQLVDTPEISDLAHRAVP